MSEDYDDSRPATPTEQEGDLDFATLRANARIAAQNVVTYLGPTAGLPMVEFQNGRFNLSGESIRKGTRFAAYVETSLVHGYANWVDGQPTEKRFWLMLKYPLLPDRATLGDMDRRRWPMNDWGTSRRDPWQLTYEMRILELENRRELLLVGRNLGPGVDDLLQAWADQAQKGKLPIIELRAVAGLPSFPIVGWVDEHTLIQDADDVEKPF